MNYILNTIQYLVKDSLKKTVLCSSVKNHTVWEGEWFIYWRRKKIKKNIIGARSYYIVFKRRERKEEDLVVPYYLKTRL